MKNYIFLIAIIVVFLAACSNSEKFSSELPECVDEITRDTINNSSLKSVEMMYLKGEHHYWLKTDYTFFDGIEYIVNSQCDTICLFCGECTNPLCIKQYEKGTWETIGNNKTMWD